MSLLPNATYIGVDNPIFIVAPIKTSTILVSSLTGNEGTFNILTVSSLIGSNIASDNITNIFKLFIGDNWLDYFTNEDLDRIFFITQFIKRKEDYTLVKFLFIPSWVRT